ADPARRARHRDRAPARGPRLHRHARRAGPGHPGGAPHALGGRARRQPRRDADPCRRIPRGRHRARGRVADPPVRPAADAPHRQRDRPHRGADVPADLPARGDHRMSAAATPGAADERLARLSAAAALPRLDAARLMALAPDFGALPFETALQRECVALRDEAGALWLAVSDPFDHDLLDGLGARLAEPFTTAIARREDVAACLARHEGELRRAGGLLEERAAGESGETVEDLSLRRISADASPVVKLVNSTLYDALKQGASDIHLESVPGGLVVKYRIDGVLSRVG